MCIFWQKVAHPLFVFLVQSSWSSSLALVQLHVEGQLLTESWERDDRNSFGWGQSCHHKTNSCYNMIITISLSLKIQNLIPVFLNSSTHGFFSLFVYYRCNQIIMFWWTQQKKLSNTSSTVVCIVISKIFSPHDVTFKKKKHIFIQGCAGMTFAMSGMGSWEQEWRISFPRVGNMKGMKKTFPKIGNGKGMKKHRGYHSRAWEQEWREQNRMKRLYNKVFRKYLAWEEVLSPNILKHPLLLF